MLALWVLSYYGMTSLVVPVWVSLGTTVLPYLYLLLSIAYAGIYYLLRNSSGKRIIASLLALLLVSAVWLWGDAVIPARTQADDAKSIKLMAWNVQRMGEFSSNPVQQAQCIAKVIKEHKPDILALLEITAHQLSDLQAELAMQPGSCKWSDYYGTGKKRYGGLAACIMSSPELPMTILQQRQLGLPPGWKYLFVEVQLPASVSKTPINFMALHVAPPKITTKRVANIVADFFAGRVQGLADLSGLLDDYKKQVLLQSNQVSVALQQIGTFKDPTIVAGDFNSSRDSAIHQALRESLVDTWSQAGWGLGITRYWGGFLPLRIDYIYASKEFSIVDSETILSECSDHRPIISEVFLPLPEIEAAH